MSNYSESSFDESNHNSSWYKMAHLIKDGSEVLDVGCSSGNFGAVLINKKNCTVDGIEPNGEDAAEASKKLRSVLIKDIEKDKMDFLSSSYDYIVFGDVIEHLVDPVVAIKKIKKYLKPNGRIIFSIPNMAHVLVRLLLLEGDFDYSETGLLDKTHIHFYNLKEVSRVFNESGFQIDKIEFIEKDIPRSIIKDYLAKIGITPSEVFYKKMALPEAAAFQFVGSAKQASNPIPVSRRRRFGPIDLFEKSHTELHNQYKEVMKEKTALEIKNKELFDRESALKNELRGWHPLRNNPISRSLRKGARRFLS